MTIVLADTDVYFREKLKKRIEKITGLHVVGESSGAEETTAMILNRKPDIAILNASLRDGRGIEVLRHIKRLMIPPIIIIVTDDPSRDDQAACSLAGANFFLEKATEGHKIIQMLHLLCAPPSQAETLASPSILFAD
ncbi:MAG TPA: response regulator [Nitrospiraceae bacterium]|nr:response regulator [Nitrospiraceae bacterium]